MFANDSFENYQDLEISSSHDLVTSAVIYDATFSGYNSIVLGTFGKSVLFFCPTRSSFDSGDIENINKHLTLTNNQTPTDPSDLSAKEESSYSKRPSQGRYQFSYELKREITFKHSVLGLLTGLISNNGALDLIILTLNGVSVWQYDPEKIIDLANKLFEQREQMDHQHKEQNIAYSNTDLTTSF